MQRPPRYECFLEFFDSMGNHRGSPAVCAPDITPLSHEDLQKQITTISDFLNDYGLGRNDRVGVVMPDGHEMAVVFLGVIACATFVPFMRHLSEKEYEFLMTKMGVNVLIAQEGMDTSALPVASELKIPIIEVKRKNEPGGDIELIWKTGSPGGSKRKGFAGPDDIAMVLNTSGTTSQPKFVPLTHANIFSSAHYISKALHLTSSDRFLHIMSMAHIAGLVSSLIVPLSVGSSIICTHGFSEELFFHWLETFRPTWYTAVPTVHRAIVEAAQRRSVAANNTSLRFIRTVASPMAEPIMGKLEKLFQVPVLQAYGLTEALSIASTPLYPYKRKPGSAGVSLCPEIAIIDENGDRLGNGEIGEVAVRGPHVFTGYENNPEANQKAFVRGWFRTGDLGHMDDEGYLFITGRLKDIINRGGQKVSPQEVEAALLSHPAVRDCCVFSVPHPRLGEAVVAAVVLTDGFDVTERDIRQYIAEKIAYYKVPQQVVFVGAIPKNSMGKAQRLDAYNAFIHLFKAEYIAPETEFEIKVAGVWKEVLKISHVGRHDNFFSLGGDSLLATQAISKIKKVTGLVIPLVTLFQYTTLSAFSEAICLDKTAAVAESKLSEIITEIEGMTEDEARRRLEAGDET